MVVSLTPSCGQVELGSRLVDGGLRRGEVLVGVRVLL